MTTVYLLLSLGFVLPVGSIVRTCWREESAVRTERELAAWSKVFAEARQSLLPVDWHQTWPQRQTPSDLPARVGVVVAPDRPRPWTTPTGAFNTLVAATWTAQEQQTLSREWWCESCLDDHRTCKGVCACPCTLVGAA